MTAASSNLHQRSEFFVGEQRQRRKGWWWSVFRERGWGWEERRKRRLVEAERQIREVSGDRFTDLAWERKRQVREEKKGWLGISGTSLWERERWRTTREICVALDGVVVGQSRENGESRREERRRTAKAEERKETDFVGVVVGMAMREEEGGARWKREDGEGRREEMREGG